MRSIHSWRYRRRALTKASSNRPKIITHERHISKTSQIRIKLNGKYALDANIIRKYSSTQLLQKPWSHDLNLSLSLFVCMYYGYVYLSIYPPTYPPIVCLSPSLCVSQSLVSLSLSVCLTETAEDLPTNCLSGRGGTVMVGNFSTRRCCIQLK